MKNTSSLRHPRARARWIVSSTTVLDHGNFPLRRRRRSSGDSSVISRLHVGTLFWTNSKKSSPCWIEELENHLVRRMPVCDQREEADGPPHAAHARVVHHEDRRARETADHVDIGGEFFRGSERWSFTIADDSVR